MDKIIAPFTEEQVNALNKYQLSGYFHPFTCCSHEGCNRNDHNDGLLVATKKGWLCPCWKYTQLWAWAFMAEPLPSINQKINDIS